METPRALLFGNTQVAVDNISAAQLHPFFRWRAQLAVHGTLAFRHVQGTTFGELVEACTRFDGRWAIVRPDWREPADVAVAAMEKVRRARPDLRVIFLDPWDQTSSRYLGVLPHVDRFLKYQRFADVGDYARTWLGGSRITDYVANERGYALEGWDVSSPLPEGEGHKIGTYWNFAYAGAFQTRFHLSTVARLADRAVAHTPARPLRRVVLPEKDIDVQCRLSFGDPSKLEWYGRYRLDAVTALRPLERSRRLAVDFDPAAAKDVSRKQYLDEIRRARIVFSPFGWGEVTWRDYEAAVHGCLLVKPSVDHVDTEPNVYRPNETYVPVRWDFADLVDKCTYYLEHPEEAERIVANARWAYREAITAAHFGRLVARELGAAERPAPPAVSPVASAARVA